MTENGDSVVEETIEKALAMQNAGYSIGLFGVLHPAQKEIILAAQKRCRDLGLDFRTKEFLGQYQGRLHGTYRYPKAVGGLVGSEVPVLDPIAYIGEPGEDIEGSPTPRVIREEEEVPEGAR